MQGFHHKHFFFVDDPRSSEKWMWKADSSSLLILGKVTKLKGTGLTMSFISWINSQSALFNWLLKWFYDSSGHLYSNLNHSVIIESIPRCYNWRYTILKGCVITIFLVLCFLSFDNQMLFCLTLSIWAVSVMSIC